jgi:hypothetical protein
VNRVVGVSEASEAESVVAPERAKSSRSLIHA